MFSISTTTVPAHKKSSHLMTMVIKLLRLLLLFLIRTDDAVSAFFTPSILFRAARHHVLPPLHATTSSSDKDSNGDDTTTSTSSSGDGKKGYKFGDLTARIIGKNVEKITGKPYKFGDLSRAIDASVKDGVKDLTGNDGDYEFGDLSKWVDSKIKGEVNKFTNNDNYEFGDLTKEIMKRVASGKYTMDDLFMLLKAMALVGASLSPVAGFLPVKMLVELLNFSLVNDAMGKVTSVLALELDKRLKKSLLGDENYILGDATKSMIANAVNGYTGKESYEFGDVTRKVMNSFADNIDKNNNNKENRGTIVISKDASEALEKWDSLSEERDIQGADSLDERIEKYVDTI